MRTLIEINHDYDHKVDAELVPALKQYLRTGFRDDAERLERFGVRVISMRHHADKFRIEDRTDGFPASFFPPPKASA